MTPGADRDNTAPDLNGNRYVRDQLAGLDGDLFGKMPVDARYESGVPDGQRAGALDFIQMTGLTRAPQREPAPGGSRSAYGISSDLNPIAPLSFYEKGVADVDESMGERVLGGHPRDASLDAALIPDRNTDVLGGSGASPSVLAFRDIIASLEKDGGPGITGEAEAVPAAPEAGDDDALAAFRALADDLASLETPSTRTPNSPDGSDVGTHLEAPIDEERIGGPSEDEGLGDPGQESYLDEPETASGADIAALLSDEAAPGPDFIAPDAEVSPGEPEDGLFDLVNGTLADVPGSGGESEASTDSGMELDDFDALVASLERAGDSGSGEELSEDWDALLDAATPAAAEPPRRTATKGGPGSGALAEAEQLMQALGKTPSTPSPALPAMPLVPAPQSPPGEPDAEVIPSYDYSAAPTRRRSRRHSRIARRGWRILKLVVLVVAAVSAAVMVWVRLLAPYLERPEDLEAKASRLMSEQRYTEASTAYTQLSHRDAADRPEAQFQAAYALTLEPERSLDETRARYEKALGLFESFVKDNPGHPKETRALCIMGRLHYQMQDYDAAITILRDQIKPLDDPAAALAVLRYLARAYRMKAEYEEAETAYLQAATLPDNYSAETDYRELGDMFRTRAGLPDVSTEDRKRFEETAAAYWTRALQVPGIDPGEIDALQERLAWQTYTGESVVSMQAPAESGPDPGEGPPAPPSGPASAPPAIEASPVPVGDDGMHRVEAPGADLGIPVEAGAVPVPPAADVQSGAPEAPAP
jgi:tetratricopeptide (TPR) repeat protein